MKAKYIRIFSDIHLDFDIPKNNKKFNPLLDLWTPLPMDTDKETILILAGDIWHAKKPFSYMGFSWIKKISKQFNSIIIVLGNHDFWHGNINNEYLNYKKEILNQKIHNVHLLQNSALIIDDLKFIGGTLWTNYNSGNPITMQLSGSQMNDFKYIKQGMFFSKLKTHHLLSEHIKTVDFLNNNLIKDYQNQKLLVVTHHLPTFQSIPDEFQSDDKFHDNGNYSSDLEYFFNKDITAWFHGHSHKFNYYNINKTKIISNPRGYLGEDTGYSENILFDFLGNII